MARSVLPLACLLVGLAGCGSGKLTITLERPTVADLDPMLDPRLAKFSLRVTQGNQITDQDAFRGSEEDLTIGQVPTGTSFDLRLSGKSVTDDTLGLGLIPDVPSIDGESTVTVKFRKPIGFIAGGPKVLTVNGAGEATVTEPLDIALGAPVPSAGEMTATPTGAWLLALSGNNLVPVRTIDHTPATPAGFDTAGTCISASPDSKNALVCHAAGLSIVPLDLIGNPGVAPRPVAWLGGKPARVSFGTSRTTAWVLVDAANCGAPAPSTLVQVDLLSAGELQRIKLDKPAGDLAVARDGTVYLSLPCEGRLAWLDNGVLRGGPGAAGAQDIVVTDRGLVVIGSGLNADKQVEVQAQIFDVNQSGLAAQPQTRTYLLPSLNVEFAEESSSTPGHFAWISDPQQLKIGDVAVAPDGRRALALFSANYKSDMFFNLCKFVADVNAEGYLLLDLASGTIVSGQPRYTRMTFASGPQGCYANCLGTKAGTMDNPAVCQSELRALMQAVGLLVTPEFVPSSVTMLFGGN